MTEAERDLAHPDLINSASELIAVDGNLHFHILCGVADVTALPVIPHDLQHESPYARNKMDVQ